MSGKGFARDGRARRRRGASREAGAARFRFSRGRLKFETHGGDDAVTVDAGCEIGGDAAKVLATQIAGGLLGEAVGHANAGLVGKDIVAAVAGAVHGIVGLVAEFAVTLAGTEGTKKGRKTWCLPPFRLIYGEGFSCPSFPADRIPPTAR